MAIVTSVFLPCSLFFWCFNYPHITAFEIVPKFLEVPLFSPPLYFNLGNFPYPSSEFTDHFLSCVQSTDEPIKDIFNFCLLLLCILISSISFQFFLAVSISLLPLPIWYYIMSAFPIRTLNILIIIILKLSDHYNICIRVEPDSDVQFVSRLFFSSIILAPLETFKWKMDVMY